MAQKNSRPVLWGGIFLLLLLVLGFGMGEFALPGPFKAQVLQSVGLASWESPLVLWEHVPREGEAVLVYREGQGFIPWHSTRPVSRLIVLEPGGEELWRRELAEPGQLKVGGENLALFQPEEREIALFGADGRLAWRQSWTWPLQQAHLSPQGEIAVILGPLDEEGNLVEKLAYVNARGQVAWEFPVRNGAILGAGFDSQGQHLALSKLLFHQGGMEARSLLLGREGSVKGRYGGVSESFFLAQRPVAGGEGWVLAGKKTIYFLEPPDQVTWQRSWDRPLQRLVSGAEGLVVVFFGEEGVGSGSRIAFLDWEGNTLWQERFAVSAEELLLEVIPGGILVGDEKGIYGLNWAGEITWHYPAKGLQAMSSDQKGETLLVEREGGLLTLLELP